MTSETTPADIASARTRNEDVWRRSSALLFSGKIDEFMNYWCEDGRYEAALPIPGMPAVITGHEALHAVFTALTTAAKSITVHNVIFHQTDDPNVAIIEDRMVAELVNGGSYENRYIIKATFSGNRIAEMLEYYGQFAHQDMLRTLGFIS